MDFLELCRWFYQTPSVKMPYLFFYHKNHRTDKCTSLYSVNFNCTVQNLLVGICHVILSYFKIHISNCVYFLKVDLGLGKMTLGIPITQTEILIQISKLKLNNVKLQLEAKSH